MLNIRKIITETVKDYINTFIQQSINVEKIPFIVAKNSKDALNNQG